MRKIDKVDSSKLNIPSIMRNYGLQPPPMRVANIGKRLLKCSRCPGSDVAEDNGTDVPGNYVCNRCRDEDRMRESGTYPNPSTDANPII